MEAGARVSEERSKPLMRAFQQGPRKQDSCYDTAFASAVRRPADSLQRIAAQGRRAKGASRSCAHFGKALGSRTLAMTPLSQVRFGGQRIPLPSAGFGQGAPIKVHMVADSAS